MFVLLPGVAASQLSVSADELQDIYERGVHSLKLQNYSEAYELFQQVLSASPKSKNALFYGAIAAEELNHPEDAIELYLELLANYSNDWEALERLIIALNFQNQSTLRDEYRARLEALWESNTAPELSKRAIYLLDKFETRDEKVYVFNSFEMKGKTPVLYKFNIFRPKEMPTDDGPVEIISIGSYEDTTQYSREAGNIGPTDRLYHLDGYLLDGSHKTYEFYLNEPAYDLVKSQVLEVLSGHKKPISSYQVTPEGGTITVPEP